MENYQAFSKERYNELQLQQIRLGMEKGLNVTYYLSPKFNWIQMYHIRKGLELGLPVSVYAKFEFNEGQMLQIKQAVIDEVDYTMLLDSDIFDYEMAAIRKKLLSDKLTNVA